jgi:hypothetical protein
VSDQNDGNDKWYPGPSSYDDRVVTRRDLDNLRRRHLREIDDLRRKTRDLDDVSRRQRRAVDDIQREASRPGPAPPPGSSTGPDVGFGFGSGPSSSSAGTDWQSADDKLLAAAIPLVGLLLLPLAIGHVTAKLASGDWPSYALEDAPGILGRLAAHPADPAGAWEPVNRGGDVPGPWVFWPAFAVALALIGALALLVFQSVRKPAAGKAGEGWATRAQARALRVRRGGPHRVVVGTVGSDRLAVEHRHSLLVVGPAYAGKTSGVTIPTLLEWPGPAVVCSTRGELLDQTIGWRSHEGEVHVYDPAGATGYPRSGWSPLAGCTTWQGAIRVARDLTVAARASLARGAGGDDAAGAADDALWGGSMSMALAPYLYAAVVAGRPMGTAIDWIAREEQDDVLAALRTVGGPAARTHATNGARPDPDRSAFLRHMYRALVVYDDPVVAASMERHEVVPDELLDGGRHTLYLTAPEHDQARFRLLNATLLRQVLAAAYERSSATAAALDPPLLVVLDQVAGITSVDDLAAVAGSGAARGLQVVSVFTDLGQLDGPDGQGAWQLLRSHPARLLLPRGPAGGVGGPELELLPALSEQALADGEAALLYGNRPPIRLRLRHWFGVKELRRRAEMPRDSWDPGDHGRDAPHYVTGDQASVWLRRGSGGRDTPAAAGVPPPDPESREFTSIFGSLHEDDTAPINVTPLFDPRGDNPFRR